MLCEFLAGLFRATCSFNRTVPDDPGLIKAMRLAERAESDRRGLPTEAAVAQVLVSKYADHLPLRRQVQI